MFSSRSGAAKLSLIVIVGLVVLKVVVALITGSISIFAQALDSILDSLAVAISLIAIRIAAKPADKEHPFGHGKIENIAALGQAILIFAAGGLIIYSAVRRIMSGAPVEMAEAGIVVMVVSIIASIFLSRHLLKVSRATDSIALEANARNILADIYSAAAVLAGLIAIRITGFNILDPIIALAVALFILKVGYDVLKKSSGGIVDVSLPKAEEDEIRHCIMEQGCRMGSFHDLRTRKAGSQRYIDLHLIMPRDVSVEEAHQACDRLEQSIEARLPNASITIHVELTSDVNSGHQTFHAASSPA